MKFFNSKNSQKGFTFAELILVLGIILTLFSFIGVNLFRAQRKVSLDSAVQTLVTDIRSQQNKAMIGAADGRSTSDNYGIYFTASQYTLFHGLAYNPTDPANYTVSLDTNISLSSINLQNNTLVFLQQSGEVSTFSAVKNTITIKNQAGTEQETVTINRYGVITNIQ